MRVEYDFLVRFAHKQIDRAAFWHENFTNFPQALYNLIQEEEEEEEKEAN